MRKRWIAAILVACAMMLFACIFGAWIMQRQPRAPIFTEEVTGRVLAKTDDSLVLQTDSNGEYASHTYPISRALSASLSVGDTVTLHMQLHADDEESVLAVTVVAQENPHATENSLP